MKTKSQTGLSFDAYKNYEKEFEKGNAPGRTLLIQRVDGKNTLRKLSKEDFILLIKTDDEFAKKWGDIYYNETFNTKEK
jgi:hypothetical protein